jgi:tetratricopeptide (TPR) repeat protein
MKHCIATGVRWSAGLAILVLLLQAGCSGRRSEQARQEGDTYLSLGRYADAEEAYARALASNPDNAAALLGQGRILARQERPEEAMEAFRKAIAADPGFEMPYIAAVNMLLNRKDTAEAEELAAQLQKHKPEAGDLLMANIYIGSGRAGDAVALLEKRREQSPDAVAARVGLAKAYSETGQPEKAEAELKDLTQTLERKEGSDPEAILQVRMALVDVYHTQGKLDAMIQELRDIVAEDPEDLRMKLVLARSLLDAGQIDEARSIAEPVLGEVPDNPWANYIIGSCYLAKKDYEGSLPYLETAAQALPNQPAVERQLALARSGGKDVPATSPAKSPAAPGAPTVTAKAPAPEGLTSTADDATAGWQELWASASLHSLVERRERFLADNPDNALLRETLTLAALFVGRRDVAEELSRSLPADSELQDYLKALWGGDAAATFKALEPWKNADDERRLLERNATGFAYGLAGLRGQALLAFSEAGKLMPDNAVYLFNLGTLYRAAQMPEFAEGALKKLLSLYPRNMAVRQLLFQACLDAERTDEAKSVAENSYGLFPDRREALLSLAQIYVLTGDASLASEVLERGLKSQPDDPALKVGLASVRLYENKPEEARKLLSEIEPAPAFKAAWVRAMGFALGQTQDWQGLADQMETLDEGQQNAPLRLLRIAALVGSGRVADALPVFQQDEAWAASPKASVLAVALGQTSPAAEARNADLAQTLAGKPDALAQYAYGLACLEGGFPYQAYLAFGRVAEAVGDHPHLIAAQLASLAKAPSVPDKEERARAVTEKHPDMPEAWLGLAEVRRALDNPAGAREALDRALEAPGGNESTDVWIQRARFAEWQNDGALATEAYRRLTVLVPDEPSFHNNLAYHLLQRGQNDAEALKEAQLAHEKMKGHPSVLHTLGLAQLRTGDIEEAHRNLRAAVEMRPGDPTLLLDYGQVLVKMGKEPEGRYQASMALETSRLLDLDFPRRAEAEALAGASAASGATTPVAGG